MKSVQLVLRGQVATRRSSASCSVSTANTGSIPSSTVRPYRTITPQYILMGLWNQSERLGSIQHPALMYSMNASLTSAVSES